MPLQPVRRPVASVSGSQTGADGSELINMYPSMAIRPEDAAVPFMLRQTSGLSSGFTVDHGSNTATQTADIRLLAAVWSPFYGNHLFAFSEKKVTIYSDYDHDADTATEFYSVDTPSNFRLSANEPARWATDGRRIVIISADEVWAFDRKIANSNEALSNPASGPTPWVTITAPTGDDSDDKTRTEDWVDIVWIDGFFIIANIGGQMWNSGLGTLTFEQLQFARADKKPDGIAALAAFRSQLYVMGTQSIERWYNSGVGEGFSLSRDLSFTAEVGLWHRKTMQVNEDGIYFVGSDLTVYWFDGGLPRRMGNDVVEEEVRKAALREDSESGVGMSFVYTEEGHKYYGMRMCFIDDNIRRYWTYDLRTGTWHKRDCGTSWLLHIAHYRNINFVVTEGTSENKVRRLSRDDLYSIDQPTVRDHREFTMPVIYAEQQRMRVRNFQVDIDYDGDETLTIKLFWSDDNKITFKGGDDRAITFTKGNRVRWNSLGQVTADGRHYKLDFGRSTAKRFGVLGCYATVNVDERM